MLSLMIPGLVILLLDHHNRIEEEMLMKQLKANPNLTLVDAEGNLGRPHAQGVGILDLFKHDHHKAHDHGSHQADEKLPERKSS